MSTGIYDLSGGGEIMVAPSNRLVEARKQLQIVADNMEDAELVEDLQKAADLVEAVENELEGRSGGG